MNALNKLSELFSEFPGIGPRQAKRFVYFLLSKNPAYTAELIRHMENIKKDVIACESCFRFFSKDTSGSHICQICRDVKRDKSALAIVSYDADLESIEKAKSFSGNYFVLGGTVPILEKEPERKVRSRELLKTVEKRAKEEGLKEVILAISFNSEGENTAQYIKDILSPLCEKYSLKITLLGRGLSTGTELEYSDSETIKNALKNRQ
jgi:recombination protein RecR